MNVAAMGLACDKDTLNEQNRTKILNETKRGD